MATSALWVEFAQIDASGKRNYSLTRPLAPQRSAPLRSVPLRFAPLHSTPLRCAPLRAAPLAGSFVSEKVAMYERDHMRRYAQIQPIVHCAEVNPGCKSDHGALSQDKRPAHYDRLCLKRRP